MTTEYVRPEPTGEIISIDTIGVGRTPLESEWKTWEYRISNDIDVLKQYDEEGRLIKRLTPPEYKRFERNLRRANRKGWK